MLPDKVTILAQTAERAQDINVKRAQEAKARAEEALKMPGPTLTMRPMQTPSGAPRCG